MRIYFDHNATTPPHPRVVQAILTSMTGGAAPQIDAGRTTAGATATATAHGAASTAATVTGAVTRPAGMSQQGDGWEAPIGAWANPSSPHAEGRAAKQAVERARGQVAALLGCAPHEIVFTSGGTEANNTALCGLVQGARRRGRRGQVISSALEHPSVLTTLRGLCEGDGPVLARVDGAGRLDLSDLRQRLAAAPTLLVSLALANHELGNLYPIAEVAALCREHDALLHCDAVQAVGRVPVRVGELGVDLLSLSGHKFYGPKGVGALYVRGGDINDGRGLLLPLISGSKQERGLRAGTENVSAVVGLGEASQLASERLAQDMPRIAALRDRLEARLLSISGVQRNGDGERRIPGTSNLCFAAAGATAIDGEVIMMNLDLLGGGGVDRLGLQLGIARAIDRDGGAGQDRTTARGAVRFSLGIGSTAEEVDQVAAWVEEIIARLR